MENIRSMATKTVTELLDDIDGKPADETVSFGLDGVQYEIDLATDNAEALREALAPWSEAARRTGGRRVAGRPVKVATEVDTKAVRVWAASNGIELSSRGRIPGHVVEQYRAAGN
jgi:nucleoid-associated protein Lsr2